MNRDLARLALFRRLLGLVTSGMGVSASIVRAFRAAEGEEQDAARLVLLGNPPPVSLAAIVSDDAKELGMLASLVAGASSSSAMVLGKKGEALSALLEGWLKAKESRLLERRVLQMRGYIMSAVLGAVMAIIAALGPVVGSIDFLQATPQVPGASISYFSAAMVVVSSSMLGIFLSGRRFYLNLFVAIAVFALALAAASPLADVPSVSLWGIK